jgi:Zn-dependent protease
MISVRELFDIVIMTVAVGYIFMGFFRARALRAVFDWRMLWFACLVTAPALIAHELAHKFTAIAAGLQATFHAAYLWLGIGVGLKLLHAPFIFFVPGYVSITCASQPCTTEPLTFAFVAFAGPALNLALFLVSWLVLKQRLARKPRWLAFWYVTQRINLLLFILNMLPIPGFDGFKVYASIWQALAS